MPDPQKTGPTKPESALDATQRLVVGVPSDPYSTQPLDLTQVLDVISPLEMPLPHPTEVASDPNQTLQLDLSNPLAADSTLKMPLPRVPELPSDPKGTQQLELSKPPEVASTLKLPMSALASLSDQTLKLRRPTADEPPIRVQRLDQLMEAAGQTQNLPVVAKAPSSPPWKVPLALGAFVVLGTAVYLVSSRGPGIPSPSTAAVRPKPASPGAQLYLEQAKAGDAHAMRMLGVMYYYGLNVPQDREKGLSWYRKAADKGSIAARAELSKLEAAGK